MSEKDGKGELLHLSIVENTVDDPITEDVIDQLGEERIINLGRDHMNRAEFNDACVLFGMIKDRNEIAEFYFHLCTILEDFNIEDDAFRGATYSMVLNLVSRFNGVDPRTLIPESLLENLNLASGVMSLAAKRKLLNGKEVMSFPIPNNGIPNNAKEISSELRKLIRRLGTHLSPVEEEEN